MSDCLQYFDFDAYVADTQAEPFDFAFLNGQPSTTDWGYDPSTPDLPDANAATLDSSPAYPSSGSSGVLSRGSNFIQQLPTESLPIDDTDIEPRNTAKPQAIPEHRCRECQESFRSSWHLERHARTTLHAAFVCSNSGCDRGFITYRQLKTHESTPHVADRQEWEGPAPFACFECNTAFKNQTQLQAHGNRHQHSPLACICGIKFARVDVLNRHIRNFSKDTPKFPCTYCKRHRGKAGFRRRDHLVQNLERYHKLDPEEIERVCPKQTLKIEREILVCPRQGCDAHRDDIFRSLPLPQQLQHKPFKSRGEYGKHMKEVHKETPFPCTVADCDRVGARGYMREKDLMKHLLDKHPNAPQYEVKVREKSRHYCLVASCGKSYDTVEDLRLHERWTHWSIEERRAWRLMGLWESRGEA